MSGPDPDKKELKSSGTSGTTSVPPGPVVIDEALLRRLNELKGVAQPPPAGFAPVQILSRSLPEGELSREHCPACGKEGDRLQVIEQVTCRSCVVREVLINQALRDLGLSEDKDFVFKHKSASMTCPSDTSVKMLEDIVTLGTKGASLTADEKEQFDCLVSWYKKPMYFVPLPEQKFKVADTEDSHYWDLKIQRMACCGVQANKFKWKKAPLSCPRHQWGDDKLVTGWSPTFCGEVIPTDRWKGEKPAPPMVNLRTKVLDKCGLVEEPKIQKWIRLPNRRAPTLTGVDPLVNRLIVLRGGVDKLSAKQVADIKGAKSSDEAYDLVRGLPASAWRNGPPRSYSDKGPSRDRKRGPRKPASLDGGRWESQKKKPRKFPRRGGKENRQQEKKQGPGRPPKGFNSLKEFWVQVRKDLGEGVYALHKCRRLYNASGKFVGRREDAAWAKKKDPPDGGSKRDRGRGPTNG